MSAESPQGREGLGRSSSLKGALYWAFRRQPALPLADRSNADYRCEEEERVGRSEHSRSTHFYLVGILGMILGGVLVILGRNNPGWPVIGASFGAIVAGVFSQKE